MEEIIIKAYAKLNLDLKILGKLDNGMHTLSSTFQAIDLFDTLTLRKADHYMLSGAAVCNEEDNLVTKAYELVRGYVKETSGKDIGGCTINLQKAIPIAAGLGGGSSDAGATLIGLNKLYRLGLKKKELIGIAALVGSDVPFFVSGYGCARVKGTGEKIKKKKPELDCCYLVARPHKRVSTKDMFHKHDETGKSFEELIYESVPVTARLRDYLRERTDHFGISGSGPTAFAVFDNYFEARSAMEDVLVLDGNFDGDLFICQPMKKSYDIIRKKSNLFGLF